MLKAGYTFPAFGNLNGRSPELRYATLNGH